jgi:trimeric autotransporter adhesin
LKPVTFRYKKEIDPEGVQQFGLVAEEVEKVNPDLVVRDKEGKPYSVRYDAVNAMLLNEFLKEHRKVEEQETTISKVESHAAKQEATVAQQQAEIRALAESLAEQKAQIQKVNARLEMSRSALKMVGNRP